jgi:hypothetical protein
MAAVYVVIVEHNLVSAIERMAEPPAMAIPRTPLEVSSQLAANNAANGCIDGRYYFHDTMHARTFAELCLEFTRALAEKRIEEVRALPVGAPDYRAGKTPSG